MHQLLFILLHSSESHWWGLPRAETGLSTEIIRWVLFINGKASVCLEKERQRASQQRQVTRSGKEGKVQRNASLGWDGLLLGNSLTSCFHSNRSRILPTSTCQTCLWAWTRLNWSRCWSHSDKSSLHVSYVMPAAPAEELALPGQGGWLGQGWGLFGLMIHFFSSIQ